MLFVKLANFISGNSKKKGQEPEDKKEDKKKVDPKKPIKTPGPLSKPKSETAELEELRESFTCPLTGKLINDPVSTPYGHMYEKAEIEKWVKMSGECPMTRQPLKVEDLMP